MTAIWQSLFANVALLAILVVVWEFMSDWMTAQAQARTKSLLLGLIMAAAILVSIAMARPVVPGFIFDLRSPLIAASALFGGVPAVIVSAGTAIVYRLYLGGAGALAGVAGIFIASAVGLVAHWIVGRRRKTTVDIFLFALAVAAGSLLSYFALPPRLWIDLLPRTGLPLLSVTFVSSVLIGVLFDREARTRELTKTNMIYRSMVRELPDCLNAKDTAGRFIAANPATAALMRANSTRELIGKTDFDFYPADLATKFREDEAAMLAGGDITRVDQTALFPDGSKGWLSTLKAPLRDEKGRLIGIITHNRDITEQKRNAQIKNEFISTVSHELRTPLTSIRGSLGLIASGVAGELPPKATNLVKIAHSNSERLVLLINDILDMEKIESGKMTFQLKVLPLRPLLETAVAGEKLYLPERNVRIVIVDDASPVEANVDPDRLQQVLANLLSNAIKFSPVDATVDVRIRRVGQGKVRISVVDRGAGISDEFKPRIFGKFEQADASNTRQKGGTGLGLSIVKSIVEKLGGAVSFDSKEGEGTAFHIDLPEAIGANRKSAASLPAIQPGDVRKRVLICEDEPDIASVIAEMLESEGLSSDVAPDIRSAKTLLNTRDYVAMTLDIKLANESGIQLFREIRASHNSPDIPVVVISAIADEARTILNGSAVGIVDWLEKPVDSNRLQSAMQKILERNFERRPNVLHVEDDEGVFEVICASLGPSVSMTFARSLAEAQYFLSHHDFDLMILDIVLPDGSGTELLSNLPSTTAVIVFSAVEVDEKLAAQVSAVMTKTKASELEVAKLVTSYLPRKSPSSTTADTTVKDRDG